MNYDQAMNEISMNELKDLPMFQRIEKKLMEQHDAEKEGQSSRLACYSLTHHHQNVQE